jgi:hypothetical protein
LGGSGWVLCWVDRQGTVDGWSHQDYGHPGVQNEKPEFADGFLACDGNFGAHELSYRHASLGGGGGGGFLSPS